VRLGAADAGGNRTRVAGGSVGTMGEAPDPNAMGGWHVLRDTGHQVMPGQALAIHDVAPIIHPRRVKHAFCNIDSEDVHLVLHWTRLLWL